RRALRGPVRIIVQMIRDLSGPETSDVAVVQIALHRLAQSAGSARRIHIPAPRKHARTTHWTAQELLRTLARTLPCHHTVAQRRHKILNAASLLIDGAKMAHAAFLSEKCRRKFGFCAAIVP